jgi:hypothetical protein
MLSVKMLAVFWVLAWSLPVESWIEADIAIYTILSAFTSLLSA